MPCVFKKKRGLKWKSSIWLTLPLVQIKNPSRKVKVRKISKVMMYLTMGKRMKIRYNVIFATRNVTKEEIVLALRLGCKRKVKLSA